MYTESLTLNDIETVELENSYSPEEFKNILKNKLAEYYANLRR